MFHTNFQLLCEAGNPSKALKSLNHQPGRINPDQNSERSNSSGLEESIQKSDVENMKESYITSTG